MDYTETLDRCIATGQTISAGAWYFAGAARMDALLDEFGYARTGRIHWERIGDDSMSVAFVPAYEYLTGADTTVAVMGHELFSTTGPLAGAAA